jgi:hypothetical protein
MGSHGVSKAILFWCVLAGLAACSRKEAPDTAATTPESAPATAPASPETGAPVGATEGMPQVPDPAARALLLGMANFIAQAPGLSVTMRSGYDAIQTDGQRIEFGERRKILM